MCITLCSGRAYNLEPLQPLGAIVHGLQLRSRPAAAVIDDLLYDAAHHGFLVFRNQSLPGDTLRRVSAYFGELAVAHTCHPEAVHCDILRLSNRPEHGIQAVGPQWHADGSFERRVYSHVLFHSQQLPSGGGGGTEISDLAAAYDSLPVQRQAELSRLASVNAFSGAVHPLVHSHPASGRPMLFMHLGQTGAVVRWPEESPTGECSSTAVALESMAAGVGPTRERGHSLLDAAELRALAHELNALLLRHAITWTYGPHDLVLLDNLAVAHRATPEAHDDAAAAGLRVLHRTTIRGTVPLDPPVTCGLPPFAHIWSQGSPLGEGDYGVWQGSDNFGAGFRWNATIPMRN